MRILPTEFSGRSTQKGFRFTQLIRDKHKALYQKTDEYGNCYYEPIIVRIQGETKIGDSVIEAGEVYPNDASFGTYGWSCRDYDRALSYYNNITYEPNIT